MREAIPRQIGADPGVSGGITRLAYARAQQAGIALAPLLKKAGLRESQIADAGARFGARNQIQFLNLVAQALPDELLGFRLAQLADLREIGLLYYVAASSQLLGDALRRAARYSKVVNEGIAVGYAEDNEVAVRFNYVGVSRALDRHQIEFLITTFIRLCWQLAGQRLTPLRARFTHHRSVDTDELHSIIGCRAEFGAPVDEVAFPAAIARLPLVGADPYLNKLLVAHFDEALSRRPPIHGAFASDIENAIAPLLPHGQARASEISSRLGMSQRTLARRLSQEGMTFSGIVERLRSALAEQYLKDPKLSVSQVAWLLGYQEVSAFTHACRRWTGKTPREIRADQDSAANN